MLIKYLRGSVSSVALSFGILLYFYCFYYTFSTIYGFGVLLYFCCFYYTLSTTYESIGPSLTKNYEPVNLYYLNT